MGAEKYWPPLCTSSEVQPSLPQVELLRHESTQRLTLWFFSCFDHQTCQICLHSVSQSICLWQTETARTVYSGNLKSTFCLFSSHLHLNFILNLFSIFTCCVLCCIEYNNSKKFNFADTTAWQSWQTKWFNVFFRIISGQVNVEYFFSLWYPGVVIFFQQFLLMLYTCRFVCWKKPLVLFVLIS